MSESTTTPKAPEVDLSQYAAVSVVRRSIARPSGAKKLPNPFEDIVRQSYETAWEEEDGTKHEHGEPRMTAPLRADSDEEKAVIRALTRAGRHVGVSVEKEFTQTDAEGNRIRKPNRAILFSAVPLKKRERKNGNGAQASEQDSEQPGEQTGAPAEGGQSDSTGMTGEQEGTPQAPGEQDNPTVVPDERQHADSGAWQ